MILDTILTRYNVFKFLANNLSTYIPENSENNQADFIAAISTIQMLLKNVEGLISEGPGITKKKLDMNSKDEGLFPTETDSKYTMDDKGSVKSGDLENKYNEITKLLEKNITKSEITFGVKEIDLSFLKKKISKDLSSKEKTWYASKQLVFTYIKGVTELSEKIFRIYRKQINKMLNNLSIDSFFNDDNNVVLSKEVSSRGFLSCAYDDNIYTLGLFLFFLEKGILLYVDWIFNKKNQDILQLKSDLDCVLSNCQYFFFLRTLNSELSIKGSRQIRQWCSWEIGKFYQYAVDLERKKFFIDTFNVNEKPNDLLSDFSNLKRIDEIRND